MASLRKASAYSKMKVTPYTRISKKRKKSFIKTVPPQKIVKFEMGDKQGFLDGKYPFQILVTSRESAQIRHNALEACRQYINKKLDKATTKQYFFKIIPFPHHVQRENKMLTGAGADRMQTGMQLSFGKSTGKAALVKPNSKIFFVAVGNEKNARIAKETLNEVKSKLPVKVKISFEKVGD